MKLPVILANFINRRYSHIVIFSTAGAGLELFMNFFHIGEVNIYRSIKRSLSTTAAQQQFEAEKSIFERVESSDDDDD